MNELPEHLSWVPNPTRVTAEEQPVPSLPKRFFPGFVRSLTKPTIKGDHPKRLATDFHSTFVGCMSLYADPQTVSAYLDRHQEWFIRCAAPMQVEPIGDNGYVLTIGRYGSFGYELEPKIGVKLLPQEAGVYRLATIDLPNAHPDYQVDFQAAMALVNNQTPDSDSVTQANSGDHTITNVEWTLELGVRVFFPAFIHRLPAALIQRTGTQLLNQVVQRISRSLTAKVRRDFHHSLGISCPPKRKQR